MKVKRRVESRLVCDLLYLTPSQLTRDYNKGIPYEEIYEMFADDTKSVREKKEFLYRGVDFGVGFKDYPKRKLEDAKDIIWTRFSGDRLFENTSLYDNNIQD